MGGVTNVKDGVTTSGGSGNLKGADGVGVDGAAVAVSPEPEAAAARAALLQELAARDLCDCGCNGPNLDRAGLTAEEMKGDPRYDVDAMLAGHGLTMDDLRDPGAALLAGGLERFFAVYRVMSLGLIGKVRAAAKEAAKSELQRLRDEEEDTRDPREVAALRAAQEREDECPPLAPWQAISGLGDAAREREMSPKMRDAAIKSLLNALELLAERELAAQKENPRAERTHLWDPLPQICFYLGIARAKLSRYTKELTGMAAHEVLDRLRARTVKEMLKGKILAYIQSTALRPLTPGPSPTRGKGGTATALAYYKALKEARGCPSWSRETFAMELGFANYRRLYRACLLYYGKTPGQLEFEVICEMCGETGAGGVEEGSMGSDVQFFTRSTSGNGKAHEGHEETKGTKKEGELAGEAGERRAAG